MAEDKEGLGGLQIQKYGWAGNRCMKFHLLNRANVHQRKGHGRSADPQTRGG